ncbi:MAG: hypothetical protein COA66_08460 [Arcobacter sp.]|nr:MAG: hypothetical protein COA66_08460 [Arcobacter sp.]
MTKNKTLKFLLLSLLATSTLYAQQTLCYKENLTSISEIEYVNLDGGICKGEKNLQDMKNDSWIIDDVKISPNNGKYSFTYIFKKYNQQNVSSDNIDEKINKILAQRKIKAKQERKEKIRLAKLKRLTDGQTLYENKCASCHGIDGNTRTMHSKKLSELHEFDYFQKMKAYGVGAIKSPLAYQMESIAQFLSDKDITNIYLYLRTLKK